MTEDVITFQRIEETEQSTLKYAKDVVLKTYKKQHALFDKKYFDNETSVLSKLYNNPCFVNCFDVGDCSYWMKRYDFALGNAREVSFLAVSRVLFSIGIDEFAKGLDSIIDELKNVGIQHRDINPGNILYSEKDRTLKLTDFFWSTRILNQISLPPVSKKHPWPVNGVYGTDDSAAMDKIKKSVIYFYKTFFQSRTNTIKNNFISSVGHGSYKDGSSVFKGFAYHIIDLPQFKNKINYHKKTCIDEYKLIKETMPLEPKSFIDIGAACGYFTFNMIRDFNISRCLSHEADDGVRQFLNDVSNLYNLMELDIRDAFDDKVIMDRHYDIAIFLNSHMWIYKQLGKEKTLGCVRNILNHCKYMYFQTCGAYSSGMYRVMEYKNQEDIYHMLFDAGAKDVNVIGEFVGSHDAPRHMFLVRGQVE